MGAPAGGAQLALNEHEEILERDLVHAAGIQVTAESPQLRLREAHAVLAQPVPLRSKKKTKPRLYQDRDTKWSILSTVSGINTPWHVPVPCHFTGIFCRLPEPRLASYEDQFRV